MSIIEEVHKELSEIDIFFGRPVKYPLASIKSYIKYEANKQNQVIQSCNSKVVSEIISTTENVCGTIQEGFANLYEINSKGFSKTNHNLRAINSTLNYGFNDLSEKLINIDHVLRWNFSRIIEQARITNHKLEVIVKLLNIPDIQKERKYYIEQGLNFLIKGRLNSLFIEKSIQNFERAILIEDTDYFTFLQLGYIYLYSKEQLDIEKSKEYLKLSILFSEADIDFNSSSIIGHSSSFAFNYDPRNIASKAMMYLSRILYK
jgi:hypothetical protein